MALEGTIKDFGLADILQLIGLQRKTGVLTLEGTGGTVKVKFLGGAVVGADTSERNFEDLLGSVLVRTGRITDAQLQESLRIQAATLQRLGYILVKQHFISAEDLEEALRIQVTQIVYRLFRWRAGKYEFAPMDHVEYDSEHFQPVSAETILMEGARMMDEWPILERRIKSPSVVFRKSAAGGALDVPLTSVVDSDLELSLQDAPEQAHDEQAIRLTPEERDVLHMVDGHASVQDIADMSALAEFDLYRILVDLQNRNLIEVVEAPVSIAPGPTSAVGRKVVAITLHAIVFAVAAASVATLSTNPFTPWRLLAHSPETARLQTFASRNRLERVEEALHAYYLDHGTMPERLEAMVSAGYLSHDDTVDPWGHPYGYRLDSAGYQIVGRSSGPGAEEIVIRHPFTASQRMVLQGGAQDRGDRHP